MNTLLLLALLFSQLSAQPVKLSGHITGLKDPSALPVTLHNPVGSALQVKAAPDGSFEFASVPPGSYTLRAPGFTTVDLVVGGGNDLVVDLKPIYSGPGVKVSGKVTDPGSGLLPPGTRTVILNPLFSGPGVTGGVSALGGSFGGSSSGTLEAWVRPDKAFEFPSVPPGAYMLRSLPATAGTSRRLEVGGSEIRDLEIVIPYQLEVTGRVLLEGRDPGPYATVQATQPTFTMATGIHSDGSFKLRLTEGENQVSMTRLPAEFSVKKISFGSVDITRQPVKVDPTTTPGEIVITLETVSLDSMPGLSVSVAQTEINDLEIIVPPRIQVAGKVVVVDEEGKPYPFRPSISMVFRLSNTGFSATGVGADGTFGMPLADSQYVTTVGNLPEGYAIKSISSGAINLMENPLIVDAKKAPDTIEVVLEYKPTRR